MHQKKWQITGIVFVLFIVLLACSSGGKTNEVDDLKSTIEALKNKIDPEVQNQLETLLPDIPLLPGNPDLTDQANGQEKGSGWMELLGQHGGSSRAIAVDGGIAYIGQGPRIVSVDISRADQPRVMGESDVLPGLVEGISLDGKMLYAVTRYGGITSFDITNPEKIKFVGAFTPDQPGCDALEIRAGYAYLACNAGGLRIVDISDPESMVEVGQGEERGAMTAIQVIGNFAYIIDVTEHALVTYDVSNPSKPVRTAVFKVSDVQGEYPESYTFLSIKQCGKRLCAAGGLSGLVVFDLDDPAKPAFAGRFDTPSSSGLAQIDDLIYLVDDVDGVHVLDISTPSAIQQVGMLPTSVGGWELTVPEGNERAVTSYAQRLYLADQAYGVTIINAADPANPKRIGLYQSPAPDNLFDVSVMDGYAYITGRFSGFRVLDISDPKAISEVAFDDERKNLNLQVPSGLSIMDDLIYISDSNYPLHIYDVSNPMNTEQIAAVFDHAASDGAYDIAIAGNYAYLSGWGLKDAFYPGDGIWVVDITSPNDPQPVNFIDIPNERWKLDVSGTTLYALDGAQDEKDKGPLSLRVIDISNPENPVEGEVIAVPAMPMTPSGLVVGGDRLYMTFITVGILNYDISDPLHPKQIGIIPGVYFASNPNLEWSDPYLVIGGNMVYDVSDDLQPKLAGWVNLPAAWAADLVDDTLYVVTQSQGLYIYKLKK